MKIKMGIAVGLLAFINVTAANTTEHTSVANFLSFGNSDAQQCVDERLTHYCLRNWGINSTMCPIHIDTWERIQQECGASPFN